jgi:hypothetical protein
MSELTAKLGNGFDCENAARVNFREYLMELSSNFVLILCSRMALGSFASMVEWWMDVK